MNFACDSSVGNHHGSVATASWTPREAQGIPRHDQRRRAGLRRALAESLSRGRSAGVYPSRDVSNALRGILRPGGGRPSDHGRHRGAGRCRSGVRGREPAAAWSEKLLDRVSALQPFEKRRGVAPEIGKATHRQVIHDPYRLIYRMDTHPGRDPHDSARETRVGPD